MAFFDKTRSENVDNQELHPAFNEVKKIFKKEGIHLDDALIKVICSGLPKTWILECPGGCESVIYFGEKASIMCEKCGRPLKFGPFQYPEGFFSGDMYNEIAGVGQFHGGLVKLRADKLDEAIAMFGKAIHFNPNYADAYYNRGEALIAKGDLKAAIQDCNKVIEINPKDADAFINRGSARAQLGEHSSALADNEMALKLGSKKSVVHLNRGICLLNLSRAAEAKKALESCINTEPNGPHADYARELLISQF